ncbi:MAG TPA: sulfite exporter TauE/SafE family protein [Casimicrobiaceae bacterium]|nr:sulfite exporter TauE/SafE family protein [Casimicrobiaceae bacterium]
MPQSLADVPLHVLVAVPLIVLAGYTVFGATGFGSNIISVPALAHFFPLTFVVPLATATDTFAATSTAIRLRKLVAWREFGKLLPAMGIGIALGASVLLNLPRGPALLALGIFAASYGIYVLAGPRSLKVAPDWLVWPVGAIGGIFSALFGSGGPIYMVFLSARIRDKSALRATSAIVVAVSVWIRLALFVGTGLLLNGPLLMLAVSLLPVMALGLWLGNRLHHALTGAGVLRLIAVVLLVNGIALVVRALGMSSD